MAKKQVIKIGKRGGKITSDKGGKKTYEKKGGAEAPAKTKAEKPDKSAKRKERRGSRNEAIKQIAGHIVAGLKGDALQAATASTGAQKAILELSRKNGAGDPPAGALRKLTRAVRAGAKAKLGVGPVESKAKAEPEAKPEKKAVKEKVEKKTEKKGKKAEKKSKGSGIPENYDKAVYDTVDDSVQAFLDDGEWTPKEAYKELSAIGRGKFNEEAELDLFAEQVVWPVLTAWIRSSFDMGVEFGFSPELMIMELYASGETAEIMGAMAKNGFFRQMTHHSTTSQYGTLSRGPVLVTDDMRAKARELFLRDVRGGAFVKEWSNEQAAGATELEALRQKALAHPMSQAEIGVIDAIQSAHSLSTDT